MPGRTQDLTLCPLLGFFDGDNLVVLAHGFQKKTQKTPAGEIALAEARKRDYLKRRRHHE